MPGRTSSLAAAVCRPYPTPSYRHEESRPPVLALASACPAARASYASSWIDPDTGHRVVQLSREPGTQSLYFTQNAYTKDGRLIVSDPPRAGHDRRQHRRHRRRSRTRSGAGRGSPAGQPADGYARFRNRLRLIQTGRKTGTIFYQKGNDIYATDPNTYQTRKIATLPEVKGAMLGVNTVNSDKTVLAGSYTIGQGGGNRRPRAVPGQTNYMGGDNLPDKEEMMERRLAERLPSVLFTFNVATGEYREILHTTDWIDHFQFSPTDPTLLMYAHEGPWHKVDRIWLTRIDGTMRPDSDPPADHEDGDRRP